MNLLDYPLTEEDRKRGREGLKELQEIRERLKNGTPTERDLRIKEHIERSNDAIKRGVLTSEM